jgi:YD repeat-containing protein
LKTEYRDPDHATGVPTARYRYDALDRVSDVTDALGSTLGDPYHTTSFTYNQRGQVLTTTKPIDPVDGQRHTITNVYNAIGTLASTTDELNHTTSYTYDDYKRLRSVTSRSVLQAIPRRARPTCITTPTARAKITATPTQT